MSKRARRWLRAGGAVGFAALGWALWVNRRLFLVNDVTTGESAEYPHLRSRVYYADADDALAVAERCVRNMARWRVVYTDAESDVLEAEVETPVGNFLDDVTVQVAPLAHGQTRVTIRSRSRLGGGDLGQNAAHIKELQEAMDAHLTNDAAI